MPRYLLTNALIVTGASSKKGCLGIEGERIAGIWESAPEDFQDAVVTDLEGKVLMAGGIDAHVHFREPGLTAKADIASESAAALLGGITSFIDMPNTAPPTVTPEALEDKLSRAGKSSLANYGFHLGATDSNAPLIMEYLSAGLGEKFGGIKVFLGSSTGNMLVEGESTLEEIFKIKGKAILVHSEDEATVRANLEAAAASSNGRDLPFRVHPLIRSREACAKSTAKAIAMAERFGTPLHILHVSTSEEVDMIRGAKSRGLRITAETSANYLWFCDEDYDSLDGRIKCNPAIKTREDRDTLRKALADGTIDTIGSDHAPHLLSEKERPYFDCPSGIPSVGHSLPAMLSIASKCGIPLQRITSALSERIARILGISDRGALRPGNYADLVVIDPVKEYSAGNGGSKCEWSPYEGTSMKGSVEMVWLNGELAVKDGRLCTEKGQFRPRPLQFHPIG